MSARLSIIPAGAVTDRNLEPRDLQVLCLLGRHTDRAGWCVRSQVKMAAEIACGRSSVQRSLERLVDAGWVQKKQRGVPEGVEPGQPSASYAYRVILDRDDYAFTAATRDDGDSHAENASQEGECPPVGTPSGTEGAQPDGHPGAHTERAPGAHTYVGTNNDPLERPHLEREREARARAERKAKFLAAFEGRWPTSASDSRRATANAAEDLTEDEERDALDGIDPFLERHKRTGRKGCPSGATYLAEKRWTLLKQAAAAQDGGYHAADSAEVRAIGVLHAIGGKTSFFHAVVKRPGADRVFYRISVDPRLLALSTAPPPNDWVSLDRQQAAAWEAYLHAYLTVQNRSRMVEGARAPWPWPPRKDGTLSPESQPSGNGNAEEGS